MNSLSAIYGHCTREGECRLWKGGLTSRGYPYIYRRGLGIAQSGRGVIWSLVHGEKPAQPIRMTCNNKLCLWRGHMALTTPTEMGRLAAQRGAFNSPLHVAARLAAVNKTRKLTDADRADILRVAGHLKPKSFARSTAVRALAAHYKVHTQCIYQALARGRKPAPAVPQSSIWAMAANSEQLSKTA